jgi:hypothetical protein
VAVVISNSWNRKTLAICGLILHLNSRQCWLVRQGLPPVRAAPFGGLGEGGGGGGGGGGGPPGAALTAAFQSPTANPCDLEAELVTSPLELSVLAPFTPLEWVQGCCNCTVGAL